MISQLGERNGMRTAFRWRAGFVAAARTALDGGFVAVYVAEAQQIDVDGKRYAVVCESHGAIAGESSQKKARISMQAPENFCDECRKLELIEDENGNVTVDGMRWMKVRDGIWQHHAFIIERDSMKSWRLFIEQTPTAEERCFALASARAKELIAMAVV